MEEEEILKEIIKIERKRILDIRIYLAFLGIVVLFSLYSMVSVFKSYQIPMPGRSVVIWLENFAYVRAGAQEETADFVGRVGMFSRIACSCAEGWKELNRDMSIFAALLVFMISVLLLPLFGSDSGNDMRELSRGTKHGKKPLDHARMLTAYLVGSFLYLSGIILFFLIKMIPFGIAGWNRYIQSRADMLFSPYHITNLEQFLMNVMIGFVALIFAVSFVLFVTVFMEKVMSGAVVLLFFWILLLLFEQMYLWPVNHYFANFMPLRMTSFSHYYIGNERYTIFGQNVSCMTWSILLSLMLACILALSAAGWERVKRKRGLY